MSSYLGVLSSHVDIKDTYLGIKLGKAFLYTRRFGRQGLDSKGGFGERVLGIGRGSSGKPKKRGK